MVVIKNKKVSRRVKISVVFVFCKLKLFVSKIKLYGLNFLSFLNWESRVVEYVSVYVKILVEIFFFVKLLKNNVSEIINR